MSNPLDAMMASRGVLIVMPHALAPRSILNYFLKINGLPHKDPLTHIEQCIEIMLSNKIIQNTYQLVWFLFTLEGAAYEWYQSHGARLFSDWRTLQTTTFQQFRPKMGQQSTFVALTNILHVLRHIFAILRP
jgi:hypothetical protein